MHEGGILGPAGFQVVVSVPFARSEMVRQGDEQFLPGGRLVMVAHPAGDIRIADILFDKGATPQGVQIGVAEIRLILFVVGLRFARAAPELADVVQQRGHRYVVYPGVHTTSFFR